MFGRHIGTGGTSPLEDRNGSPGTRGSWILGQASGTLGPAVGVAGRCVSHRRPVGLVLALRTRPLPDTGDRGAGSMVAQPGNRVPLVDRRLRGRLAVLAAPESPGALRGNRIQPLGR